ncbi:hypothetical protein [Flavobacterium wongokense]|uniref:hypothetical protein n=1 Tax=Flavobacterium wongokense TaxID=2910674 RepID=UPI001F1F7838|nr:hypothetical protein [Flavobacterium sp. WG47]MCF6132708.1 hypothetical protein [Flavobacterium sp. WG47]
MTEKIEQFYQSLYQELQSKLGSCIYKDVDVIPMTIQFYLNTIINSKALVNQIQQLSNEDEMQLLVERYFEGFFKPKSNKFKLISQDIFRYFYHLLFHKTQKSNADFFVFITNKKFFSYSKPIKEALEQQGKKVEFLLWDKNDADSNNTDKKHLPKSDFPSFSKGYFEHHNFTTLVDRANGFLPLLKNKKLIVIEGDLESQHILGLLGSKNNFETYCLQWGFFGKTATKPGWRNMPFDKFLVWGDFFEANFKPYNPQLNIISCGHPSLKDNEVFEKGKVILFAVQKKFGEHITTQDVLDFIHFAAKTAKQMPDYKIIIRSHPDFEIPQNIQQEYQSVQNIIWHDYKNFSLNQSFDEAKYCVSISSTVSLESIAYGCYPLYVKINELPLQIHELLSKNSNHQHVFDSENFIAGIQHLETQHLKNYLADFKNKLYKNLGTAALNAIVSELNT